MEKAQSIKEWPLKLIALLLFLFYFIRLIPFYLHPSLFAEEGNVFLPRVISGDWSAAHTGYLQIFTYAWIWISYHTAFWAMPWILTTLAALIQATPFLYFLLPHWESLLSFRYRVAFVLFGLCLGPYHEGLGTILHSYFYIALGGCLLLLESFYVSKASFQFRNIKWLCVFVGGISGPAVFISSLALVLGRLISCFLAEPWNWERLKREALLLKNNRLNGAILLSSVIQIVYSLSETTPNHTQDRFSNFVAIPQAILHHAHMREVLARLLPLKYLELINHNRELAIASIALSLPLLVLMLFQKPSKIHKNFALSVLFGSFFCMAMVFLARPFFFNLFRKSLWNVCLLGDRYNIIPGNLFLLASLCLIANTRLKTLKFALLSLFIPALVWTGFSRFFAEAQVENITSWPEVVKQVEEYQTHRRADIKIDLRSAKLELNRNSSQRMALPSR